MEHYIPLSDLENRTRAEARHMSVDGAVAARRTAAEIDRLVGALQHAERRIRRGLGQTGEPSEAGRWLLDNLYLAQQAAADAVQAFRSAGRLPAVGGRARICRVCAAILASGDGEAEPERIGLFLDAFQDEQVLTLRELRLTVPGLCRAVLASLAGIYASADPDPRCCAVLFTTLRRLGTLELRDVLESVDRAERILRRDPAGIYPLMDRASREAYRRQVSALAEENGESELRTAERILSLAEGGGSPRLRHVGAYLPDRTRRRTGAGYAAVNALAALALSILTAVLFRSPGAGLLSFLSISQLVKTAVDRGLLAASAPRMLSKLDLSGGIPPEGKTVCVISSLLAGKEAVDAAVRRLEEFRAAEGGGENLLFGLLCDLPESGTRFSDSDRQILAHAAERIETLNRRWSGGFFLFFRERSLHVKSGRFIPWERKRGALLELCLLLSGKRGAMQCRAGDLAALQGTRYVLTLDSDTRPEPESVTLLIAAALHPLNQPETDPRRGVVVRGHGILQPRIGVGLQEAFATEFSRLFSPQGGIDPYASGAGEVYMDRFDSGGFSGKGLIHIGAYLTCLEKRIPTDRVLSHDALEGAFLRGGTVGDAAFSDGFPSSPLSWLSRQHRWIRGDWQNLPWIFGRGRDLPPIERWRLLDSLRRSLLSAGQLAALGAFLLAPSPGTCAAGALALACIFSPGGEELLRAAGRPLGSRRTRLFSAALHGAGDALRQSLFRLVLLPADAWTSVSAAVCALWRMGVSHRNMLQWRTAEQTEAAGEKGMRACFRQMWFSAAWGGAVLAASPFPLGRALGVLWIAAPALACASGRKTPEKPALTAADRDWLLRRGAELWRYFRENCTPGDHFLPPDNVQDSPPAETARRVSPTNLGLAFLSGPCALKLGIASREEALGLCENLLTAAERLEKWRGHLFNWYDNRTMRPLPPGYISTVDSGNLAACLIAGAGALRELGEEDLAGRAERLYRAMDFSALYDETRDLFHIGLTPGEERRDESWYDLLESEERLAGYIAAASRQVPLRHWRRLSRARVGFRGFRGMVSWSGTMFEYLMPELFLPLYKNSALWESARFALYVQRTYTMGPDRLWGVSESAFFSMDETNHYRYKAHGVPALALCRGMGGERVLSPYSSFLALSVSPRAAVVNLRKMERDEYMGPYGFWEAVDFTPGRSSSGKGSAVRCVMAHHAGMSLAAVCNALCGGAVRNWFLSDPAMAAHTALLQEKVPLDGALLKRRRESEVRRGRGGLRETPLRTGRGTDYFHPESAALSNGTYHLLITESGVSRGRCGGMLTYAVPRSPLDGRHGVEAFCYEGEKAIPLLPVPGDERLFSWAFGGRNAMISGSDGPISWSMTASVSDSWAGESRILTIRRSAGAGEGTAVIGFEPVMLSEKDFAAQPAFGRLGIFTRVTDGVLTVRRLSRNGAREQFLALAADVPAAFSSDGLRFRPGDALKRFQPNTGWQSECFVSVRMELSAGQTESRIRVALCQAGDETAAVRGAKAILAELSAASAGGAENGTAYAAFDGDGQTDALLRALVWPTLVKAGAGLPAVPRERLWKLGISGDLPIHGVECTGDQSVPAAAAEVRRCALLHARGVEYDLVLLTDDGGDYRRACRAALEETLEKLERSGHGRIRGRVHFASLTEDRDVLLSCAVLWSDRAGLHLPERTERQIRLPARCGRAPAAPPWRFDGEGKFCFETKNGLPPRCWSNILWGGGLGWIAADSGTGSLWYDNARECALIPWTGDPLNTRGPERLYAGIDGEYVSFFASDGDGTVTFGCGEAVWEKTVGGVKLRLTAFILPDRPVRVMILESSRSVEVHWCAPMQMAPEREDASCCRVFREADRLCAVNPRSAVPELSVTACCSVPWHTWTGEEAFFTGSQEDEERHGDPALCGSFTLTDRAVLLLGCCDAPELLDAEEAQKALESCRDWWRRRVCALRCEGAGEAVSPLLNGWSAYQALACRVLGRGSMYQSGGAVGFRDQLQDCVNLLWTDGGLCRSHILACCRHQYDRGDVQHWWHPGPGSADRGVRTRCSDDLLWLPWAVCGYVEATGDVSLCFESVPFLTSPELTDEEVSRYELPAVSGEQGTVLDHCRRASALVLCRGVGAHKLLYMGGGDWNDGFDAMGEGAESVWLTWFASMVFHRFGALLQKLGQPEADKYAGVSRMLAQAADGAWDGDHYLRGWYGDGTPLGAGGDGACRIDSMAQSFAAFCPHADPEKVKIALDTALSALWDRENHRVLLFDPPFGPADRSPGYVSSYGPGFRENGGQYTHAAVWLARACFRTGRWEDGAALLRDLALTGRAETFGAEPFVLSADVYSAPGLEGRAGWSWYTGAAGWWYRVAWEDMLGFRYRNGVPGFEPPAPAAERGWKMEFRSEKQGPVRFPASE